MTDFKKRRDVEELIKVLRRGTAGDKPIARDTLDLYTSKIMGYHIKDIHAGINYAIDNCDFFPSVSMLKKHIEAQRKEKTTEFFNNLPDVMLYNGQFFVKSEIERALKDDNERPYIVKQLNAWMKLPAEEQQRRIDEKQEQVRPVAEKCMREIEAMFGEKMFKYLERQ